MINWPVVIIGFILVIVLSIIGGKFGLSGSALGVLMAGAIVGFMVNGDILNGTIHGALIGIVGALILALLAIFIGHVSTIIALYVGVVTVGSILLSILVGAIGVALGSLLSRMI
ncbi:MAG: DUF5518 domain-containing protein [Methanobacterium sp. ERen5]|nr:MAG: DUF5518 domain-containing protein [Methanobacterium sp. ERen5]